MRALDERRTTILASIEEQGKMTDDLREKITAADNITLLEDLYAPYKPKRRTRASIAREKGLSPWLIHRKQFRTPEHLRIWQRFQQ